MDTVGAVAVDRNGITASGISSGGVALKTPGRVGQAAMFGAGCWASANASVTTSGVGEFLIRTLLAKEIGECLTSRISEALPVEIVQDCFCAKFIDSPMLNNVEESARIGGILSIVKEEPLSANVELICAHNTPTMCMAYASSSKKTVTVFSQKKPEERLAIHAVSLTSNKLQRSHSVN